MKKIQTLCEDRDMTTDDLKSVLKAVIDRYGFDYLGTHAVNVYEHLPKERPSNRKVAGALLLTLLNGIPERARESSWTQRDLAALIRGECLLEEGTADELAKLYLGVFSAANEKEWEARKEQGFVQFCEKEWLFSWEGEDTWYVQDVHIDCEAQADIVVQVQDVDRVRALLAKELRSNPFITAEDISAWFEEKLMDLLDEDFSEYVQADDYYPPVAEDYMACEVANKFCKEHGLRLVSCEESGSSSDYEPN
ncbi:MAG: hypothetical protein QM296_00825 [Bacillota bacterium]|nr:hypothetical protein [Bacillota bacterium]